MKKRSITARLQYEALHHWSNADSIPEVSFLKHPHRHIFHIEMTKEVGGSNREVEFIQFKRQVEIWLRRYEHDFGERSCEQIAEELLEEFKCCKVSVSEDGENSATVEEI